MNRRYKRLQELIKEDDYFSEEAIRFRDPLLYFLYVGQYKRNGEQKVGDYQLSNLLIDQIQRNEYELQLQQLYDKLGDKHDYPDILSEKEITPEELVDNEDMLIRLMHEKWLYGLDDYNYKEIDENQYSTQFIRNYDDDKEIQMDEEENYFNDDIHIREQEGQVTQSEYNGIQDY